MNTGAGRLVTAKILSMKMIFTPEQKIFIVEWMALMET
jgi:hypothetical protein